MINFIYYDDFYHDLEDLKVAEDLERLEDVEALPDDYSLKCYETKAAPIAVFDANLMIEAISDERFPDDDSCRFADIMEKLEDMFNKYVDFDKINAMMPKLQYRTDQAFYITKQDLLDTFL